MRTSGERGTERWIVAIPILALIVVSAMSTGRIDSLLVLIGDFVRSLSTAVVDFARTLS
jgi:hypothetical protein